MHSLVLNGPMLALAAAAAALRAEGHRGSRSRFDVTDESARRTRLQALDEDGIAIDILVNNAGIQLRKPMVELATAEWQQVIDTNLTSAFLVGREAAQRMIARGAAARSSTSAR